nr:non-specific lipid-transfer protein 1-like [Ipomoea batatas]
MAVVGNLKQLKPLLLLCIITFAVLSPWAEAQVSCDDIYKQISPCSGYVKTGGAVPADCCPALKTMVDSLKTKLDRQSACQCIKDGVAKATPEQLKRAQGLPGYCKVPFPFKISPDVDCSAVPKRM